MQVNVFADNKENEHIKSFSGKKTLRGMNKPNIIFRPLLRCQVQGHLSRSGSNNLYQGHNF